MSLALFGFIRPQYQPPPGHMATTRDSSEEETDSETEKKNPKDFSDESDKKDTQTMERPQYQVAGRWEKMVHSETDL